MMKRSITPSLPSRPLVSEISWRVKILSIPSDVRMQNVINLFFFIDSKSSFRSRARESRNHALLNDSGKRTLFFFIL